MNKTFQVIRLCTGPTISKPHTLGEVELRPASCDLPAESQALNSSRAAFGRISINSSKDEVESPRSDDAIRVSTIVSEKNTRAAIVSAEARIEEALDAIEVTAALGKYDLQEMGFIRDMTTSNLEPIRPMEVSSHDPLRNIFRIQANDLRPLELDQVMVNKDTPGRAQMELADRLLRSSHWSRKARKEANPQLRMLFRWFAIESIWKFEGKGAVKGNEDVISPVRWALGFPNGPGALLVRIKTTAISKSIESYSAWDGRIETLLENMRIFRNDSVHNGFRFHDISVKDLKSYDQLSYVACQATQTVAERALHFGFIHPREVLEYFPILFEQCVEIHHIINLIHSFEHPEGFFYNVQPDWNVY